MFVFIQIKMLPIKSITYRAGDCPRFLVQFCNNISIDFDRTWLFATLVRPCIYLKGKLRLISKKYE